MFFCHLLKVHTAFTYFHYIVLNIIRKQTSLIRLKKEYSQAFFIINTLVVCCCSLLSLLKNQAISVSIRRPVGNVGEQNIKN